MYPKYIVSFAFCVGRSLNLGANVLFVTSSVVVFIGA
jgi:hypothetical protein